MYPPPLHSFLADPQVLLALGSSPSPALAERSRARTVDARSLAAHAAHGAAVVAAPPRRSLTGRFFTWSAARADAARPVAPVQLPVR